MTINDKNEVERFVTDTRNFCKQSKDYRQIDQATAIKAECINKEIDRLLGLLNRLFLTKGLRKETIKFGLADIKADIKAQSAELIALHEPNRILRFFGIKAAKFLRKLR
jgi:hypothetical protein